MLQKLRREFVVITMALVGLVLVVALGSALVAASEPSPAWFIRH